MSGDAAQVVSQHSGTLLTLLLLVLPLIVCAVVARMPRKRWLGTLAGVAAGFATAFVIGAITNNGVDIL